MEEGAPPEAPEAATFDWIVEGIMIFIRYLAQIFFIIDEY